MTGDVQSVGEAARRLRCPAACPAPCGHHPRRAAPRPLATPQQPRGGARPPGPASLVPSLPSAFPLLPPCSPGYVIPTSVVRHFLEDYKRHGSYTGFPSLVGLRGGAAGAPAGAGQPTGRPAWACAAELTTRAPTLPTHPPPPTPAPPARTQNVVWQEMDSKALKRAYGMEPHQKGVLVRLGAPRAGRGRQGCAGGAVRRPRPCPPRFHASPDLARLAAPSCLPPGALGGGRLQRGVSPGGGRHHPVHWCALPGAALRWPAALEPASR